jgi:hypothetical protein
MRAPRSWVATTIIAGLLTGACNPGSSAAPATRSAAVATTTPTATDTPASTPHPTPTPNATPMALIDHAMGVTDIVMRYDDGPSDYGICELCGGWGSFTPGPEFTLYGDGTFIHRLGGTEPISNVRPIIRARPFRIGHLDELQVQALLRFALDEGGLRTARDRYDTTTDTDDPGQSIYSIRAGDVDKVVEISGSNDPFLPLVAHLRDLDGKDGVSTQTWEADRYWGLLIEVSSWMEVGVLPRPDRADVVDWPWPAIAPWTSGTIGNERRVMSAKEAAVMGLSDEGGVVQRLYVHGHDDETIYAFSLWPMFPDERS